jgi:hypothetical protein
MKVPRIKEIVASVTLLVMIAGGGVAVSLAQDSSPIAFSHSSLSTTVQRGTGFRCSPVRRYAPE